MNKMILIFSLLIAFAISVEPECKAYEIFDEETNKCIKVCNEQQFVNQEEGICEYFCKKGEIFNSTTYTCYSNNSNEHDGVVLMMVSLMMVNLVMRSLMMANLMMIKEKNKKKNVKEDFQ